MCVDPIRCIELSDPVNGYIEYSSGSIGDQSFGATAIYVCEHGFGIARGDRVRTCEGDGSSTAGNWTGIAPLCRGKKVGTIRIDHSQDHSQASDAKTSQFAHSLNRYL